MKWLRGGVQRYALPKLAAFDAGPAWTTAKLKNKRTN